ncbi:methyltransferase [Belliella sp. DSM 111904]|uniref:tRNA1(Val) (adenine(37)-N6)-methyltransferase n=1 Tax=Belliella filtrata TaxID=2923435 RepID=A0ABS9UXA3_9BACT|nr:methyltransferase [Belliella filtrata]MCH7408782.1 methyltransferase [Belliella filtrata]
MKESGFRFKQFVVMQDQCGMKISTDAVLLGAIAGNEAHRKVLDIGSGTGVISLMLAQRLPQVLVDAVEIDEKAYGQALENFQESPFSERMKLHHVAIQDFCGENVSSYDLIVSNPPYYPDHLKSSNYQKNQAMHTDSLSFEDLVRSVDMMLHEDGEFWLILPPAQMDKFVQLAIEDRLYPHQCILVRDKAEKPVIRQIVSFCRNNQPIDESQIIIKNSSDEYSTKYSELLKEFLIIF